MTSRVREAYVSLFSVVTRKLYHGCSRFPSPDFDAIKQERASNFHRKEQEREIVNSFAALTVCALLLVSVASGVGPEAAAFSADIAISSRRART